MRTWKQMWDAIVGWRIDSNAGRIVVVVENVRLRGDRAELVQPEMRGPMYRSVL